MNSHPPLCGHSGATLRILTKSGHAIVRKSSPTIEGNARLLRQMEKQQAFAALGAPIRTPEIFDSNTDDEGRFYFDMEFVAGLDGHKFLEKCTPDELRSFSAKLSDHLSAIHELPAIGRPGIYPTFFDACVFKLIEIHHQHVGLGNETAGSILSSLEEVRGLGANTQAFCHGDFTLENIMIDTQGHLLFVDFLDSTFEHPVQDLVKLSQDIHGGWFQIRGRRISGAYIAYLDQMLGAAAEKIFPGYAAVRNVLQALNFCRILPYVSNNLQRAIVLEKINKFVP